MADASRCTSSKEDRLRKALESAQLGAWSWDRASDVLTLDDLAAQLFGVPPGTSITRTELRDRIVLPEDLSVTTDNLRQSIESGARYYAEYRIGTAPDTPTWVATSGLVTSDPGSHEITGMVGTVQDITARKLQEATLRESEKLAATGRLAATIAHEINNPLEAITNLIYLSRTDDAVPAHVQELLETADAELARVAQIAQQTLGFYRDTTRPVTIDLNEMLYGTVDLFQRKMRSRSVTCNVELEPGLTLFGLQGEIRQVFSNLLVNAIDASDHGVIHIRSRRHRICGVEGVTVLIADQGAGVPHGVRDHLFTPFVTTKQSVGTGLGLWVTRGIVEKQGGCIQFRTRTESPTGTCFRVFLPVRPPAFPPSAAL